MWHIHICGSTGIDAIYLLDYESDERNHKRATCCYLCNGIFNDEKNI